jgi:MYND finger
LKVSKEELGLWKAMIPAMIERCRTSEHGDIKGVVNSRFKARTEWAAFAPHVVRCALSPLFPAPFIHETKMQTLTLPSQLPDDDDDFIVETGADEETGVNDETGANGEMLRVRTEARACRVCGKDGSLKKCGRCESVFYCSIECQRQDWNRHKTECRAPM